MNTTARGARQRDHSLDGLRGVAALSVVAFHFVAALMPSAIPDQSTAVPAWADSPLEVLLNGPFWVFVFFVLSGFVLGRASYKERKHFWRDVGIRYLRLALPATASVVLAWALLSIFPLATTRLNELAASPWLKWTVQGNIPSLFAALKDGLYSVFRYGYSYLNSALWTMRIELIGSLGVYAFFQFCRWRTETVGAAIVVALVAFGAPSGYVAFALGAGLSIVARHGFRLPPVSALLIFAGGLLLGSEGRGFAQRHGLGAWPAALRPGEGEGLLYPIGALAVLAGVLGSPVLQRLFESRPCQFLGRLSFPLYLVHVPLLYTVVAAAAVRLYPLTPLLLTTIGFAFLFVAMALAWVFEIAVDKPVLALNRRIGARSRPIASVVA